MPYSCQRSCAASYGRRLLSKTMIWATLLRLSRMKRKKQQTWCAQRRCRPIPTSIWSTTHGLLGTRMHLRLWGRTLAWSSDCKTWSMIWKSLIFLKQKLRNQKKKRKGKRRSQRSIARLRKFRKHSLSPSIKEPKSSSLTTLKSRHCEQYRNSLKALSKSASLAIRLRIQTISQKFLYLYQTLEHYG